MSRAGDIELVWGDGTHKFRLAIGQLRELQEKCNAGPQEVLERLSRGKWRIDDIRETIRLGLIGGGDVKPAEAVQLIMRYVDERPWLESAPVAQAILMSALVGPVEEPVGKKDAAAEPVLGTNGSTSSPPSTGSGLQ